MNEELQAGDRDGAPFGVRIHMREAVVVAEVIADGVIIRSAGDALDVMVSARYEAGTGRVVLHAANVDPTFFDLATGLAGEILQKVSNYGLALAIVGDYTGIESRSLGDFIRESNGHGQVVFVGTVDSAVERLAAGEHG